jgi:iron complex transport system permease protein
MRPESIVLTGIALNYIFSAMTSTIEFFAAEHKLASVVDWTFGTFNGATWKETLVVAAFVLVCTLVIARFSLQLNVISSGEDELVKSLASTQIPCGWLWV